MSAHSVCDLGRVAICHEWLVTWGGSEQVSARMAEVVDASDVFTFTATPELAARTFPNRPVRTSRLGRSGVVRRLWRWFLPLMARWWRGLNLDAYDTVITCSHSVVNSIRSRPDALHVSYCCTPMRYAWLWRTELHRLPLVIRPIWPVIAGALRRGDRRRARNVDVFIAASRYVAERIERCYGRTAEVVYPPVDTAYFTPDPTIAKGESFLCAGRLVAYKRIDIAVRAAEIAGVRLVVAGTGPELRRLERIAGSNVEFVGAVTGEKLRDLYRRARGFVFPGVEDFGMTMVEAQACGTPVIARAEGGALEAVEHGVTGVLYGGRSVETLAEAMKGFDPSAFAVDVLRARAETFGRRSFDQALVGVLERLR